MNLNVNKKIPLDQIDGLDEKLQTIRTQGMRDLIRYSGTENKIRLLLEGKEEKMVKKMMDDLVQFIQSKL